MVPIATPKTIFDLLKQKFETIHLKFCTNEEHQNDGKLLQYRFSAAITIKGTRSFHFDVPEGEHEIKCKTVSNFDDSLSEISKIMQLHFHEVYKLRTIQIE